MRFADGPHTGFCILNSQQTVSVTLLRPSVAVELRCYAPVSPCRR